VTQRVGRGIALLSHDRGTRRGDEWSAARPGRNVPPGKTQYPFYRGLGGSPPGPVWTGRKSRPHRDSIPDLPARSSVTIPTELPSPPKINACFFISHYHRNLSENTLQSRLIDIITGM
jgi:hypothetical protein